LYVLPHSFSAYTLELTLKKINMITKPHQLLKEILADTGMKDVPLTFINSIVDRLEKSIELEVNLAYKMGYDDAKFENPRKEDFYNYLHEKSE
jgi:hypothetical protein